MASQKPRASVKRIGGYLHRIAPVLDNTGKIIDYVTTPLMVELRRRDLMQIVVGATILAVPVAFTSEVWELGETLPLINVLGLGAVSLGFMAGFVYYNFYRRLLKDYVWDFVKRVLTIYLFSLLVVGLLLTLIGKAQWGVDDLTAVKRIIIVAFPASMSAAVSDMLK